MYGYVTMNRAEMKFKEYDVYHAYYCGLCRELKEKGGPLLQLSLSYDLTFLTLLLSSLYEPEYEEGKMRCLAHPFEAHPYVRNHYTSYVADMNRILLFFKTEDDWRDEKKILRKLYGNLLKCKNKKTMSCYRKKSERIMEEMKKLRVMEEAGEDNPDAPASCFGNILAEVFAPNQDEWSDTLREIGYYMGRFIYIMDAYDDMEKDEKKKNYNVLLSRKDMPDFDEYVRQILLYNAAQASKSFETLPVLSNAEILRNILYSGMLLRFDEIRKKKTEDKTKEDRQVDERSL